MIRSFVLFALVVTICPAAWAESAPTGSPPVVVEADHVQLDRSENRATFTGNVRLRQGMVELRCDELTAELGDGGRLTSIVATGNVRIVSGADGFRAQGGRALFAPGQGRVTLTGNPVVHAQGGQISGRRIVVDLRSERVTVEGARGVFQVQ